MSETVFLNVRLGGWVVFEGVVVERERWRGLERGLGRGGLAEGRVVLGS